MLGSCGFSKAARRRHSDGCREAEAVLRQRPPHLRPQGPANDKNARASVGVTYRTHEAIFVTAALVTAFPGKEELPRMRPRDKRRHDKERCRYCGGVN